MAFKRDHGQPITRRRTPFFYDKEYQGALNYIDSVTKEFETGSFHLFELNGEIIGTRARDGNIHDLLDTNTSNGDRSTERNERVQSVFRRSVNVPEPSSFVLFGIALMGLVSRRLKNNT